MLIDSNATHIDLWQQQERILDDLFQISNLPITASSDAKDKLKSEFFDYLFEQSFDALHGGILVSDMPSPSKTELFYKPIALNSMVCECLVSAAVVFYEGEFMVVAEKIISMLCDKLESEDYYLLNELSFTRKQLESNFSKKNSRNLLDGKEIELLNALTTGDSINNLQSVVIAYHRSLENAANMIDMHYKQARIVEHRLCEKLKFKLVIHKCDEHSTPLPNPLDINCDLVIALANFSLCSPQSNKLVIAEKVYEKILGMANKQEFQHLDLCKLIHAGIILLQCDFRIERFQAILDMTSKFTNLYAKKKQQMNDSTKINYQIAFINSFVAKSREVFNSRILAEFNFVLPQGEKQFRFTFINSESVDLDHKLTGLRSKFDPNHFIFVVDPSYMSTLALK